MMRVFCDWCGQEIDGDEREPNPEFSIEKGVDSVGVGRRKIKISLRRAVDGVWNGGDVHVSCLLAILQTDFLRREHGADS